MFDFGVRVRPLSAIVPSFPKLGAERAPEQMTKILHILWSIFLDILLSISYIQLVSKRVLIIYVSYVLVDEEDL
jgi:hypothetical protein